MSRNLIPGILAMAAIVVASNILVQFLFGQWLTWGAFTYPFAFLVTDLTNRIQGPSSARKVVVAGFVVGVMCSLIVSQITPNDPRLAWMMAEGVEFVAYGRSAGLDGYAFVDNDVEAAAKIGAALYGATA